MSGHTVRSILADEVYRMGTSMRHGTFGSQGVEVHACEVEPVLQIGWRA